MDGACNGFSQLDGDREGQMNVLHVISRISRNDGGLSRSLQWLVVALHATTEGDEAERSSRSATPNRQYVTK